MVRKIEEIIAELQEGNLEESAIDRIVAELKDNHCILPCFEFNEILKRWHVDTFPGNDLTYYAEGKDLGKAIATTVRDIVKDRQ